MRCPGLPVSSRVGVGRRRALVRDGSAPSVKEGRQPLRSTRAGLREDESPASSPLAASGPRRLPPRILALVLLRALVILASFTWLAFAPPGVQRPRLTALLLFAFLAYSVGLYVLLWRWTVQLLRWNVAVLAVDTAFALMLVHLTGGAQSVFFLAFYLIAALQAYYYGTRWGVGVALGATVLYLAVVWPTLHLAHWPDYALRTGMLLLTAVGLGIIGELQEREQATIRALNEALADRERYIAEILESLRDGVVVLDQRRRITGWNRAMVERFGLRREEVLGRSIFDVFPSFREKRPASALDRLFAGEARGLVLDGVIHEPRPGERRVLNVRGSVTGHGDSRQPEVVLLVEDVTDRIALEQSTRQAEKLAAIGTLSMGLAHEINNPIGIISSRIELMLEEADAQGLPASVRQDLEVLRRHALRVARITRSLLSFARQAPSARLRLDLNAVVQETLLLVARQAAQEGIAVRCQLAPSLPPIVGDANQLAQVLLNLLTNAREAIRDNGEILIETGRDQARPGWVCLTVHDNGCGIPEEHQAKIFEPFFTTKPGGTGLGLAVSYGIVRDHGGMMSVRSRPGVGTTFSIALPPAQEAGVRESGVRELS